MLTYLLQIWYLNSLEYYRGKGITDLFNFDFSLKFSNLEFKWNIFYSLLKEILKETVIILNGAKVFRKCDTLPFSTLFVSLQSISSLPKIWRTAPFHSDSMETG